MSNSFGTLFKITSFGESHGLCVGIIVDGCPAGMPLNEADVQKEINKRKPGAPGTTARAEQDKVEIMSGIFKGRTTGAPICMLVFNKDINSGAYEKMRFIPRPGQADYTSFIKYGGFNDYRGGGRFSGRITLGMVMAGAVAKKVLESMGINVLAHTIEIGGIKAKLFGMDTIRARVGKSPLRCADISAEKKMTEAIEKARQEGDSLGGIIECLALSVPAGLGEPVFDTLEGELSKALYAIPAVKGVEFGAGFEVAKKRGSENNDLFRWKDVKVVTLTNNAGGILGGISTGMPLVVKIAIKPTPSIPIEQQTIDLKSQVNTVISVKGRHDTCIVPRAVVVVEAMVAVTLCDFAIRAGLIKRVLK